MTHRIEGRDVHMNGVIRRMCTTVLVVLCIQAAAVTRADAWFGFFDELSGPGMFWGAEFDVRIVCAEGVHPEQVRQHVETARAMLRYSGLTGRVRLLLHQLTKLAGSRKPDPGSRVWEAQLELNKLPPIIADKIRQLSTAEDEEVRSDLIADLHALESQVAEHAKVASEMVDQPGRGFVAAETPARGAEEAKARGYKKAEKGYYWRLRYGNLEYVAKGQNPPRQYNKKTRSFEPAQKAPPELPFPAELTKGQAYDELGGYDRATDFGEYFNRSSTDIAARFTINKLAKRMAGIARWQPARNFTGKQTHVRILIPQKA